MNRAFHHALLALVVATGSPAFAQAPSTIAPVAEPRTPADAGVLSNVKIGRVLLGSGEPGAPPSTLENATQVYNNLFHAPQYMPFFPTAATIWPRVIEVPCRMAGPDLVCERYYWRPEYGRGEYLFFSPVVLSGAPAGTAPNAAPGPQDRPVERR